MEQTSIQRLYKILGTVKYADESWSDVLERINKDGGVDIKTTRLVLGVVLDELHGREKTNKV